MIAPNERPSRTMLDEALDWRKLGYPVFPVCTPAMGQHRHGTAACTSPGKRPLVTWESCQSAVPAERQVIAWWRQWPLANIGMATGHVANVVVLDADSGEARKAVLALGGIDNTPVVWTGKPGGAHFWLRYPGPEARNFAGKLPGVDFRGDGGYVLLPPSLHASGARYRWAEDTVDRIPADVPRWLLEMLSATTANGTLPGDHTALDIGTVLVGIGEGKRDETLFKFAAKMRGDDVPIGYARTIMAQAAARCSPPFPVDEAIAKVDRVYRQFAAGRAAMARQALAEQSYPHDEPFEEPPDHPPDEPDEAHVDEDAPSRPLTETGNAERFRDRYGSRARYCHPWGQWLPYDGKRWRRDDTGAVRAWAKLTVRAILAEAASAQDDAQSKALAGWARKSESARSRSALLTNAEVESGIPILPDQMDADPYLLNVQNGTVDLRTGELRPHKPEDYVTKLAPVECDPEATCPTFDAFLSRVLSDETVRTFVQRFIGYSATGVTSEQCLAFLYGGGANGKTTLLGVVQTLLGDYVRQAAPELLVSRGGDRHPTELADLFGSRLVLSVEVDEGKRLAETLVKQMTGGDRMKARFMGKDFFEWTPTHKLILAANHQPIIVGTDYAIWRRIHLVPFTVTIPPEERDPRLAEKLRAELPGVLNWLIAGCLDWYQHGLGVPQAVRDATEAYRAEQDVLADWLEQCCVIDPQASAPSGALYKTYSAKAEQNGEKPLTARAFGLRLAERGFRQRRTKVTRLWEGVRLLEPNEPKTMTHLPSMTLDDTDFYAGVNAHAGRGISGNMRHQASSRVDASSTDMDPGMVALGDADDDDELPF